MTRPVEDPSAAGGPLPEDVPAPPAAPARDPGWDGPERERRPEREDPPEPDDRPEPEDRPEPDPRGGGLTNPAEVLAVEALGLGLHGRERWAYRDIQLALPQRSVLLVTGPKGSGRSTLLLTLSGRMKHTDGRLTVFGHPLPYESRAVRRLASVARIGRAVNLEPGLTVAETVTERSLLDVVRPEDAQQRFAGACSLLDLDLHRHALVEDLSGLEQTLLALAVTMVGAPAFLVLDDVGAGLHSYEEARVWRGIRALADAGLTIAGTTTDPGPADGCWDAALRLDPVPAGAGKGRFR